MKYDTIKNPNYVATVVRVAALEDLEGLDNLKALRMFGMQALVSKDTEIGSLGVLFSTEVQLSSEYAAANNLHRHANLNVDPTKTGYLEDSRRVKAIKLRGHRSDSIFMPLDSFSYLRGVKPESFESGDTFDSIDGHEILRKYVIKEPKLNNGPAARIRRVDLKVFPLHIDSENYWRNSDKIPGQAPVVITQKLHGTSARFGTVPVLREKGRIERFINRWFPTTTHEARFVVGSRMVVKSIDYDAESATQEHFYAEDLWSSYAKEHNLDELIPEGYLVYGEIIGWTPDGKPIQKDYTYDLPHPSTLMVGLDTWDNETASTTPSVPSTPENSVDPATSVTSGTETPSTTRSGSLIDGLPKSAGVKRVTSDPLTSTPKSSANVLPATQGIPASAQGTVSVSKSSTASPNSAQSAARKSVASLWTTITGLPKSVASSVTRATGVSGSSGTTPRISQPQPSTSGTRPAFNELYVYRVATVTPTGVVTDLSWPAAKAFAQGIGLKTVPELHTVMHRDFHVDKYIDTLFYDHFVMNKGWAEMVYGSDWSKFDVPVPLSDPTSVDEGVCVRYDGPNGIYILKAKSPIFLGHESAMLDAGAEDLEAEEAAE